MLFSALLREKRVKTSYLLTVHAFAKGFAFGHASNEKRQKDNNEGTGKPEVVQQNRTSCYSHSLASQINIS